MINNLLSHVYITFAKEIFQYNDTSMTVAISLYREDMKCDFIPQSRIYVFFEFLQLGQGLAPGQIDSDNANQLAQCFRRFHAMVSVQNPVVPGDEDGLLACVGPVVGDALGFRLVDLLLGLLELVRGNELQLAGRDVVALVEEEPGVDLLGLLLLLLGFLAFALLLGLVVHLAQGVRVRDACG